MITAYHVSLQESIFYQDIQKGASFVVQQDKQRTESMVRF